MLSSSLVYQRHHEILKTTLGAAILALLAQDDVIEVMANPDGKIWIDTLSRGKCQTNMNLSPTERSNIIQLIASMNDILINKDQAEIACELHLAAARFQGFIPPVSPAPTFAIRKKARRIHTLEEYETQGWITAAQILLLKKAIHHHLNILIAGGTGSGKTTFANALLNELRESQERMIILEDLPELQIHAADVVTLRTTPNMSMRDLVKSCLRMRPDRIIIGEVRDGAALDLLKAWNTGHPGGFCTLHANRAASVIARLEDLILEAAPQIPQRLISEAVDLIVFMQKAGSGHYVLADIKMISEKARDHLKARF